MKISLELHLSLTLIPVIQKSTISSCGVISADVIAKRQLICLSVAANQDSQTRHYPFSDHFDHTVYTSAPDNKQKKQVELFLNTLVIEIPGTTKWTDFTEEKKQHSCGWLKHLKSLSKTRNKSSSMTIYPVLGIYRHQKWRVKPATFL